MIDESLNVLYFQNERWLKVFYYDCNDKNYFSGPDEAKYSLDHKKYSILQNITDDYKIKNSFEFLIYYPSLKTYYRWRQSKNPLNDIEEVGTTEAKGFTLIYPKVDNNLYKFGGLVKSTIDDVTINSLLDGIPGDKGWYFAIGMFSYAKESWLKAGIPALTDATDIVSLYLLLKHIRIGTCNRNFHFFLNPIFLFIIII